MHTLRDALVAAMRRERARHRAEARLPAAGRRLHALSNAVIAPAIARCSFGDSLSGT